MKLCKDCKWALNRGAELGTPRPYDWSCRHPAALQPPLADYVTGTPQQPHPRDCLGMRDDPDLCGPEGRYWEAAISEVEELDARR